MAAILQNCLPSVDQHARAYRNILAWKNTQKLVGDKVAVFDEVTRYELISKFDYKA